MNKENHQIEFKKATKQLPESFWETYSAFANTNGGWIVLGVDENNETNPYIGVDDPYKIKNQIFALGENKL